MRGLWRWCATIAIVSVVVGIGDVIALVTDLPDFHNLGWYFGGVVAAVRHWPKRSDNARDQNPNGDIPHIHSEWLNRDSRNALDSEG